VGKHSDPKATIELDGSKWRAAEVLEVVVEVINSGNKEIVAEDYMRSLTFDFGEKAQVLLAEILYEEPNGIGASVKKGPNKVTLVPVLLNARDRIGLRMLVSGLQRIIWDGRIVGVKKIAEGSPQRRSATLYLLGSITNLCMGPAIIFPELVPRSLLGVAWALLVVGGTTATVGLVIAHREQRLWRRRVRHTGNLQSTLASDSLPDQRSWWKRLLGN
jgi:hypothetical protein